MGIFGKNPKQPALPNNVVDIMERFGRIGFDSSRGKDVGDVGEIWGELAGQVLPLARADPESFLVALANAVVPVGGWAVYGASRVLWDALSLTEEFGQNPSYNAIMDAGIDFLRMNGGQPSSYEWQHWVARGGTHETWLPQTTAPAPDGGQRSPAAWVEIGDAHADNAHYTEALAAYDLALKLDPAYAPAYAHKADASGTMRQYEQALLFYKLAIQWNPTDAGSYAGKGLVLYKLRRYQEALEAYDRAIQIIPTVAAGHTDKGEVLTALGRYEEAIIACDQALQINPNYSRAYANKGTALAELNRNEEALANYDRAFQLDPSDMGACAGKGLMLTRLNRPAEALNAWNTIIQRKPSADAYTRQGLALAALNRQAEALDAYNYALQLDPNYTLAQASRQQLRTGRQ